MVDSTPQKTLLVTGGTGYIGSHTVVELLESQKCGFTKIVIVDNLENSSTKVLDRIGEITKTQYEVDFFLKSAICVTRPCSIQSLKSTRLYTQSFTLQGSKL